uniref:FHA domain-containing protein n=1 Tax=Cuerna arida TaxID=1464854 RepID=A0A1B6H1L1_9HEMI
MSENSDEGVNKQAASNKILENVSPGDVEKETKPSLTTFKKPQLLVGPQRGKNLKSQNKLCRILKEDENDKTNVKQELKSSIISLKEEKEEQDKLVSPNASKPIPPLPYKEPEWGGLPLHQYTLEELKSGTIVKTIDLSQRSFWVFGRLEHCDIPMLHPTVSRYHAVLQYRVTGSDKCDPGFYILDLDSSLGTFVNKQKLRPHNYTRVKVGYVLKLGCSTRMFILQGPEEDEEPESNLSVTELKQQYQEKLTALEAEHKQKLAEEEERIKREEERGIDWGMGEDADEETDLTENPYAVTQNEDLYVEDPKKTLRGWFEREGEELVYDVEEKGFGHFICRIELPVDNGGGGNLVAEASVKGKKKEAVVQAALEACRLLDTQGLLRQATHESKKRAAKDWEAMDFYDSDEDNFLDRTGHIEKKRQQRMAQSGKLETAVETYDTLVDKYKAVVKELEQTEHKLNDMLSLATQTERQGGEEDELDAYMSSLKQVSSDKIEIKKMKGEVTRLRSEEEKLRKLVNLARPTELPKLEPFVKPNMEKKIGLPQIMVGKMGSKKRTHQEMVLPLQTTQQSADDADEQEEFDEDEEKPVVDKSEQGQSQPKDEVAVKKKRNRPDKRNRIWKQQSQPKQVAEEEYSSVTWCPPSGQTGDGKTSLNEKFGY